MNLENIEKLQDNNSDWYWIPKSLVAEFNKAVNVLSDIDDYMDNPDTFDEFEENFGHFRTGGDKDNMPLHFQSHLK